MKRKELDFFPILKKLTKKLNSKKFKEIIGKQEKRVDEKEQQEA